MVKDHGLEFEHWLRFIVPGQLNLSRSKCIALEMMFSRFADYAQKIAVSDPENYEKFFEELKQRMEQVSRWRKSKDVDIVPMIYEGEIIKYSNGKMRYQTVKKMTNISENQP